MQTHAGEGAEGDARLIPYARINHDLKKNKLQMPVLTIGVPEFFGEAQRVVEKVERTEVFEECGLGLALEAENRLAGLLREFVLERGRRRCSTPRTSQFAQGSQGVSVES